jgi:hypothetical protein
MKLLAKETLADNYFCSMNRNLLPGLLVICCVCLFSSCEKDVDFQLRPGTEKVVVEGTMETGLPPYVFLTKSIGLFSSMDLNTLANAFLHDAVITVSDGNRSVTLKEYQFSNKGIPFYFYTVDSADIQALTFRGIAGKTYHLEIQYAGDRYTSDTHIPFPVPLDSLWAMSPPAEELPEDYPDSRLLYGQYTDPDTLGNRIRYFTQRNGSGFLAPLYSVYDDAIINGTTVSIQLPSGFNKMDSINRDTFGYFYKGDTVVVKWCSIDKHVFDFWRTLEYAYGSTGNPFASPVEVSTNISGGALGVWAGYGSSYDTLIIHD